MLGRLLIATLCLAGLPAAAQTYPDKPIRWIVPYAANGPADVLARTLAPRLADALRVQVIVENNGGSGGSRGVEQVAKAAPDGYTLALGGTGTHSLNPYIQANVPYDPVKDFAAVTPLVSYVNVLVVNAQLPIKSVAELVAYAKERPTAVTFGSAGRGSSNHLAGELLKSTTGAPMGHIPYRGSAPALADVVSGQVTFMFDILATAMPQISAGKVRPLAVASAKRSPFVPGIPTMAEAGVVGFEHGATDLWFGVFAPANTPKPIVERLNAEIRKIVASSEVSQSLRRLGYDGWTLTSGAFAAFIRADYARWGSVVAAAGLKPE